MYIDCNRDSSDGLTSEEKNRYTESIYDLNRSEAEFLSKFQR